MSDATATSRWVENRRFAGASRRTVGALLTCVLVVVLGSCSGRGTPVEATTTVTPYVEPSPDVWPNATDILAGIADAEDIPLTVVPLTVQNDPDHEVGAVDGLASKAYAADDRLADRTEATEPMSVQGGAYVWVYKSLTRADFERSNLALKYGSLESPPLVFSYGPIVVVVSGVLPPRERALYSGALNEYIASIS